VRDLQFYQEPDTGFPTPRTLIFAYYGVAPVNGTYMENNERVLFVTAQ